MSQACQGGDNQVMLVIESSWIQNRVFYLVFTVVASEPDLSKVQQQHLLQAYKRFFFNPVSLSFSTLELAAHWYNFDIIQVYSNPDHMINWTL